MDSLKRQPARNKLMAFLLFHLRISPLQRSNLFMGFITHQRNPLKLLKLLFNPFSLFFRLLFKMLSLSSIQPAKPKLFSVYATPSPMGLRFSQFSSLAHFNITPKTPTLSSSSSLRRQCVQIKALDDAQSYDTEAKFNNQFEKKQKLKIGIVGFGNFGQFLAKTMANQGHCVLAHSRSDYSEIARELGVSFFTDPNDLCEEHPEVIMLCTSILSTESVLKSFPLLRLKRSTLFVDVLSVKEFPRSLFLQNLPAECDILCTHPMFGPESGKNGWKGLNFVYDKVRIGNEKARMSRCDRFLDVFAQEGCNMVEMSCAEHDWHAAGSQFMTHTVGRVLEKLVLSSTPINTKGYETLLGLVDNTSGDSFDLYYGLFMYNKNAMEQLERLDMAFESLKQQLFGHLHDVLRKQLFDHAENADDIARGPKLIQNGSASESGDELKS